MRIGDIYIQGQVTNTEVDANSTHTNGTGTDHSKVMDNAGEIATNLASINTANTDITDIQGDVQRNLDNIMINAFRVAVQGSLSQQNMVDGVVDEFEDEAGIDGAGSTNEDYDSTDDYYSPYITLADITTDTKLMIHANANTGIRNPYCHYLCNETSGTTVEDIGQGSNNGTSNVNTSLLTVPGKISNAFDFNGSEYINVDTVMTDIKDDTVGSFSLWVYATADSDGQFVSFNSTTTAETMWISRIASGDKFNIYLYLLGDTKWGYTTTASTFPINTWVHFAVAHDGVEAKFYVNGVEDTSDDWHGASSDRTAWLSTLTGMNNGRLGCLNYNNNGNYSFYTGRIDDFRYYKHTLSQLEIDWIYNSGSGREENGIDDVSDSDHNIKSYGTTHVRGYDDMIDISAWTDDDNNSGVSSQATFDGKETMKLISGTSATGNARRKLASIGVLGDRTVFSFSMYIDYNNTYASNSFQIVQFQDDTHTVQFYFCSDGLWGYDSVAGWREVGTDLVVQDTWQDWTIDIDWTGDPTCDIYIDGVSTLTDVACHYNYTQAGRAISFSSYNQPGGGTSVDAYIDWFKIGTTLDGGNIADTLITEKFDEALYFNGNSHLTVEDLSGTDWDFITSASGSKTFDFWVKFNGDFSGYQYMVGQYASPNWWSLEMEISGGSMWFTQLPGQSIAVISRGIPDTKWHHIAVVKIDDEYAIYIDGQQTAYQQTSYTYNYTSPLYIGQLGSGAQYLDGSIDEFRWNDSNVFNANPTDFSGEAELLMHFDGDDGQTKTVDNSMPADNCIFNGGAKLSSVEKKFGDTSLYLDGVDSYAQFADRAYWDITQETNATIDFWMNRNSDTTDDAVFTQWQDNNNYQHIGVRAGGNNDILWNIKIGGVEIINMHVGAIPASDEWHHVAFIKVGNDYGVYVDGVQVDSGNSSNSGTIASIYRIGTWNATGNWYHGYLDELRLTHTNAFEADPSLGNDFFTPPTAPHTVGDTITVPTEEYVAIGETNNMTLISESSTAQAVPESARIVLLEEDVDSITLNTDIKAYVSRDGGSTWAQATLTDIGNYDATKQILAGNVDLTASGIGSGTSLEYKIETLNNKDAKFHGVGLSWD